MCDTVTACHSFQNDLLVTIQTIKNRTVTEIQSPISLNIIIASFATQHNQIATKTKWFSHYQIDCDDNVCK